VIVGTRPGAALNQSSELHVSTVINIDKEAM
jgi:hypothetical protein